MQLRQKKQQPRPTQARTTAVQKKNVNMRRRNRLRMLFSTSFTSRLTTVVVVCQQTDRRQHRNYRWQVRFDSIDDHVFSCFLKLLWPCRASPFCSYYRAILEMRWIKCLLTWRRGKRSGFHLCVLARPSASLIHLVKHPADISDNFLCCLCTWFLCTSFRLNGCDNIAAPRFIDFHVILDVFSYIIVSAQFRRKR